MSGYTKVNNWLFDEVMPSIRNPNAFRVICAVARCTWGWNKERDKISYSQFRKLTGIKNRTNLSKAIQDAIESGYLQRMEAGNSFFYTLSNSTESVPDDIKQYRISTEDSTESVPKIAENGTESVHTKETNKDNINILADYFTSVSGIMPGRSQYVENWKQPLEIILNGGDVEKAKQRIKDGVEFAREKRYTVSSPRSIVNIVANMKATKDKKVTVRAI